ncbi:GNAT family N-acetyltransferase [Pseudoalteromonas fuliginea]|uniref:GCN5 family acetyltransferase n=1 Tax=Pseudoalteromonas fuliginea TaxID=1872678 RepID=A0ABD3YDK6_9GAMM|nr:GNAT family N-acetyltransferase [Pseudoalteromonas fuliginea]KDC53143.1 GCN5 family acetyltransferase [Pseudoalteromonas fuliginea]KJZ29210.1 GCN5 family acetyltransferase [Pseudoalteromonas fuliginea]
MVFKFIKAAYSDRDYLLSLRKLTMVEHLENAGLFLTDQQHVLRLDDQYDCSHLIVINEVPIGTLKYQTHAQHVEIMQLQIHPLHQNKGYGKAVIEQVITNAQSKPIKLTVLKNNPALGLYKRLGFTITDEDNYEYHMQTRATRN